MAEDGAAGVVGPVVEDGAEVVVRSVYGGASLLIGMGKGKWEIGHLTSGMRVVLGEGFGGDGLCGREGKERKGKERKGKERKGKERKGILWGVF